MGSASHTQLAPASEPTQAQQKLTAHGQHPFGHLGSRAFSLIPVFLASAGRVQGYRSGWVRAKDELLDK